VTTEKQLFEANPASPELRARVFLRAQLDAQDTCKRLVGMGHCAEACPDDCEVFTQVGLQLVNSETDKALAKPEFGEEGQILLNVIDDDFRRLWNKQRNLIQEPTQNKLTRLGEVTRYGRRFLAAMKEDEILRHFGGDDFLKLKIVDSWLRNLWDDACDNALMHLEKHQNGERTYRHRKADLDDVTARRYGYRADRLYRRRMNGETECEFDANISEGIRPARHDNTTRDDLSKELLKVANVCDALFRAVEQADAEVERYTAVDLSGRAVPEHLSTRSKPGVSDSKPGVSEISLDDADRLDDGQINASVHEKEPLNPRTLFDDFAMAWGITRREHRETSKSMDPTEHSFRRSVERDAQRNAEE
jgi:hypothetical protein